MSLSEKSKKVQCADIEAPQDKYIYLNSFLEHDEKKQAKSSFSVKSKRKVFSKVSAELDKYYTKPSIAQMCYDAIKDLALKAGRSQEQLFFIEPSAGSGVFLDCIVESKAGFDIAPTKGGNHNIARHDFLKHDLSSVLAPQARNKHLIFIGNPPFGRKAQLAIEFVNKALTYSEIVGFIVPIQFRKWSVQSKINKNAHLILDMDLEENAFEFMGKDYSVRCCFQVWALQEFGAVLPNLRIKNKPAIEHPDFELYQYNRTEQAKKFFDYDWDFAVPRQGYLDYTTRAFSKAECNMKHQWIFFKARNPEVLKKLLNIDYERLSRKNIGLPGFGKADVVQAYIEAYP